MKKKTFYPLLAAAGMLCAGDASANQWTNDSGDGDNLWSNADNWTAGVPDGNNAWVNAAPEGVDDPAIIDYSAPNPGEMIIGQGGGDGAVEMTTGGSITAGAVNMAWGADRSGLLTVNGGEMNAGNLRMGRSPGGVQATVDLSGGILNATTINMSSRTDEGGPAGADSFLNVSGGTLDASGDLEVGHLGGDANVDISGGTVNIAGQTRIGNLDTTSTATGTFTMTGGSFTGSALTAIGTEGDGMGRGHVFIGGDAEFSSGGSSAIVFREGGNTFTVDGSNAAITATRASAVGLEFNDGNTVTFNFDAGGPSTVDVTSNLWVRDAVTLDIDASDVGPGLYTLFTFASNVDGNEFTPGNITLGDGSWNWDLHYNTNDIQFEVIPEPSTYAMIFGGLVLGLALIRRRLQK